MNETKLPFSFPTEEGREWRKFSNRENAWKTCRPPGKGHPSGYLFAAHDCHSFPLWINSEDSELIPQLVVFEIERITGIELDKTSPSLSIRKVARKDSNLLIHATVVGDDITEGLDRNWKRFSVTPNLYHARGNEIHLWREDGRWTAGFFLKGILIHWQSFGQGPLATLHAKELRCISEGLNSENMSDPPERICLHGNSRISDEVISAVENAISAPIERFSEDARMRFPPQIDARQKPRALVDFQERKAQIGKRNLLIGFITLVFLAVLFAGWYDLKRIKNQVAQMENRAEQLAPKAERIRRLRDRWDDLSPATQQENYPVEIFHRVAVLLPKKGIRLSEFQIQDQRITIRGEASNVPTAIKFKADLEGSSDLNRYEWDVPPPQISGYTAKFVAFGVVREFNPPVSLP